MTTTKRGAVVIMIDLSLQMGEAIIINGRARRQGEVALEQVNDILSELYLESHSADRSAPRCDVAVFGYSGAGVSSLLKQGGDPFVAASDLALLSSKRRWLSIGALSPLDSPDDYEYIKMKMCTVEFGGSRPMGEAYRVVLRSLKSWMERTKSCGEVCNAPHIININCGEPTDSQRKYIDEISQQIEQECQGDDKQQAVVRNVLLSKELHITKKITYGECKNLNNW